MIYHIFRDNNFDYATYYCKRYPGDIQVYEDLELPSLHKHSRLIYSAGMPNVMK